MSLATDVVTDFSAIAADFGSESVTHTRTGPNTTTTISTALVFETDTEFGDPNIPCYEIRGFVTRFLVSALSPVPKIGDTITRSGGSAYEVVEANKVVRDTQWRLVCKRASINSDYAVNVTIKRGTVTQNSYGVDTASLTDFVTSLTGYLYLGANVHQENIMDVINSVDTGVFYVSGGAQGIMPSDVLVYSGVSYDITDVEKDGRIAMLCELKIKRIQ